MAGVSQGRITHAIKVIERLLQDGPVDSRTFAKALEAEGVSVYARNAATKQMGVVADRTGPRSSGNGSEVTWRYSKESEKTKTETARVAIQEALKDGPISSGEFAAFMAAYGVSDHIRKRVTKQMGVVAQRSGLGFMWKYQDKEEIPRMGPGQQGWECPTCGGYGWVYGRPKYRNPRGVERIQAQERDRAAPSRQKRVRGDVS